MPCNDRLPVRTNIFLVPTRRRGNAVCRVGKVLFLPTFLIKKVVGNKKTLPTLHGSWRKYVVFLVPTRRRGNAVRTRQRPVHHHRKKGTMEILLLPPTLLLRDCIPTPERGNEKKKWWATKRRCPPYMAR